MDLRAGDGRASTGFVCFRMWTAYGFHKMQAVSWLDEKILNFREGLCSVEAVRYNEAICIYVQYVSRYVTCRKRQIKCRTLCNYMNFRQFTFSFASLVTSSRITEFLNWVVSTPASYLRIPCFTSRPKIPLSVCQERLLNTISNWVTVASFHVTYN